MFTPEQYREKAAEYSELLKTATAPKELHEFQRLEQSFTTLADNEQWLADNYAKTVRALSTIEPTALPSRTKSTLLS